MKITLARLQTALALAIANGDTGAASSFTIMADRISAMYLKDPYIMPDVLTPPASAVDVAAMTKDEVHDAVQAGVITRQDAVDAGVIAKVDDLSPHPDEIPTIPASDDPAHDAPAFDPVTAEVSTPAAVADLPAETPVTVPESEPTVSAADSSPPVAPTPTDGATPSTSSLIQPTEPVVPQSDSGDEDPTPPEKETIASLDKRLDAIERPGKVSRQ